MMSRMSSFRRRGFVKTSEKSTGDGSVASSIVLTRRSINKKTQQEKTSRQGEGGFDSRQRSHFSTSIERGAQGARIGVAAFLLASLCAGLSTVLGPNVFGDQIQLKENEKSGNGTANTCTRDQPLVWGKENILDADTFEAVRHCLTDLPMLKEQYRTHGFGAHGFEIHFLSAGEERFMSETRYNCGNFNPLIPFFQAARHAEANGFVLRVLSCDPSSDTNVVCQDTHLDENLYHNKSGSHFLAHSVSVVYVSVPSDMKGGDLELFGPGETASFEKDSDTEELGRPDLRDSELVTPIENMLVEFRGDSWHQVQGYSTETSEKRISLVLEQFKLPAHDEQYFPVYHEDFYTDRAFEEE